MQVPVDSIALKERVRKDLGDLAPLMQSMKTHGQLNPIVITRSNELIAGHRRLESAKRLGWYTVDAVSIDTDSDVNKLEMELEENVYRKDLSPEELLEGYRRLEKLKRPPFFKRVARFIGRLFRKIFRRRTPKDEPVMPGPHSVRTGTDARPPADTDAENEAFRHGDYAV